MKKGTPIVEVTWVDACKSTNWWTEEELNDMPTRNTTVGYLVGTRTSLKKKHIVIADSISTESAKWGGPICIPLGCVVKVKTLRKGQH